MHHHQDRQAVRFAGGLALGLGTVLMILTLLGVLYALFNFRTASLTAGTFGAAISTFLLALLTSSAYMGLGTQLTRVRVISAGEAESLRMSWTALFLISILAGIAAFWLIPPLVGVCALMLIVLLACRGAVIRLTT